MRRDHLEDLGVNGRIILEFIFDHRFQAGSEAHPASYSMGTGSKAAGA
jgi:hypothetical protein